MGPAACRCSDVQSSAIGRGDSRRVGAFAPAVGVSTGSQTPTRSFSIAEQARALPGGRPIEHIRRTLGL
jgi:hypothetical protein